MQQRRLVIVVAALLGIAFVIFLRLDRESDEIETTLESAALVAPKIGVRRAKNTDESPASRSVDVAAIRNTLIEHLSPAVGAKQATIEGVVIRGIVRNTADDHGTDAAIAALSSAAAANVVRPLEEAVTSDDGHFEIRLKEPGCFLLVIAPRQSKSLFRPVTRTVTAARPGDVVDLETIAVGAEANGHYALFGLAPLPYAITAHPHTGGFGNVHDEIRAAARTVVTPSQVAVDFDLSGCEFVLHCVDMTTRMPVDDTACFLDGKGGWGGGPFPAVPNSVILRRGAEYGFRVEHADYERFSTTIKTPSIGDTLELEVELVPKPPGPILVVRLSGAAAAEVRELWAAFEGLGAPAIAWWRPEGTLHTRSVSAARDAEDSFRFPKKTPPTGRYRVRLRADGPLDGFGAEFARPTMIADMSVEVGIPTAGEVFVDVEAGLNGILCFTIPWSHGEKEPSAEITVDDAAGEKLRCEFVHDMFPDIHTAGNQLRRTRFVKPALPTGSYTITATFADGRKLSATVTIEPGKTTTAAL